MKHYSILLLSFFIYGCSANDKSKDITKQGSSSQIGTSLVRLDNDPIINSPVGQYTGDFEALQFDDQQDYVYLNKITISIDSLSNTEAFGRSFVAGNSRPFKGNYSLQNKEYIFEVKEPGDHKFDGQFTFKVAADFSHIIGVWKSFDNIIAVTERQYNLQRKLFIYSPDLELPASVSWTELYDTYDRITNQGEFLTEDVLKLNASTTILTKEDVENMYKGDLEIIRNTIYARHGYSFKNRKIRFIFDGFVDWYMPISTNIQGELTAIERQNINLLKRYEEHAVKYYDLFGR